MNIKHWITVCFILSIFCVKTIAMSFSLSSPAFVTNTMMPKKYTCNGENISPALGWQGAPLETQSYVLMVDDPDAPNGSWVHWVLFNIPASIKNLNEATPLPHGAISGKNSWETKGYNGPCPPSGTHRYFFTLYALDSRLTVNSSVNKQDILNAMQGHILASTELIGLYKTN